MGLAAVLWGCAPPDESAPTRMPSPGVTLTPYLSAMPAATRTPTPGRIASPTPPPAPTATPFLYTIVEGDTLIGIAFRFGLTLADLLAANPGIDPQFLSIGDDLIIPLLDNPAAAAAVPTPVGFVVPVGSMDCYPSADGSLWCFQMFENQGGQAVEGVSAQFTLYDREGEPLDTRIGRSPVNLFPTGETMPLAAWFPGAGPVYGTAGLTVLSALPVQVNDPRYIDVSIDFSVALDGEAALVSGIVEAEAGESLSAYRLGLVALDAEGVVVGVRVLELDGGGPASFEVVVYSLSEAVDQVIVFAEGYP